MKRTREELRSRILWAVFLCTAVAVVSACTGGWGDPVVVDPGEREVTTTPSTTPTLTSTAAPASTTTPTAQAAPITTITPAATETFPTPPPGPLSGEGLVSALRRGGYVIYFRHAATDPVPDDADPVSFSDCSTQRNLSAAGRMQAVAIGEAMERLGVLIGIVLSSPFCRALDTAQLAFGKATREPVLENLETAASEAEREARILGLRRLLSTAPDGGTNGILVGHGFNIAAAADVTLAEGEAAIFRPEEEGGFTLVATVTSGEWEAL